MIGMSDQFCWLAEACQILLHLLLHDKCTPLGQRQGTANMPCDVLQMQERRVRQQLPLAPFLPLPLAWGSVRWLQACRCKSNRLLIR